MFPSRSLGEGEGGQASSSLAVIHTAGLRRCSSKLKACSKMERGRRIGEVSKGSSLWGSESLLFIEVPCQTLMGPPLVGIGSASNKIRASSDISYPNLYSSQYLPYVCDPLGPISSWPWVIPVRTPSNSVNYYLCNNSLDLSTTDVLGHNAVVPRRYRGIQSIGPICPQLSCTYSLSSI